jgi:hypothetical protein
MTASVARNENAESHIVRPGVSCHFLPQWARDVVSLAVLVNNSQLRLKALHGEVVNDIIG